VGEGVRTFDPDCRRCSRLAAFLDAVGKRHPDYHCRPVAPFGSALHRLLIVGLAPGLHGANRTGRPFTGDHAGILLYRTLHAHGFASRAESMSKDDGLRLLDCRITNAVKCLPPANKPLPAEVRQCNAYLVAELDALPASAIVVALGGIAHAAVLRAAGLKPAQARFAHGACHVLPGKRALLDSYHCSRYNTQTRRLTADMLDSIFALARHLLDG
jgi:uracil-DNA glycosylase family 4